MHHDIQRLHFKFVNVNLGKNLEIDLGKFYETGPRPSRASGKRRLKKGKGFFASLSKQRTGLQYSLLLHAVPKPLTTPLRSILIS